MSHPPLPCVHIGVLLQWFRREFAWRLVGSLGPHLGAHDEDSRNIQILLSALAAHGMQMTSGEYAAIEQGALPSDVGAFMRAFAKCYALSANEADALWLQAGYDILSPVLGPENALKCLHDSPLIDTTS